MSKYSLYTVLSCHGLEDFPTHHKGAPAHDLLVSLTALWHPAIVAQAQTIPRWCRFDQIPENCAHTILVVPSIVGSQLPTGLTDRVQLENGLLLQGETERPALIAKTLTYLHIDLVDDTNDLGTDFLALGFAYWQVQLMTRQLRYSSHLDEVHFQNVVVAAAIAFTQHNYDECRRGLQSAFDLLMQERNRYFPVEALFIELLLVASTTIGEPLFQAIQSPTALNVMLTGDLIERIATQSPRIIEAVRKKLTDVQLEIVGGSAGEPRFSLMSLESLVGEFARGSASFRRILGVQPACFGRRRFGLTSVLPQVLLGCGYRGAIHVLFDHGKFPAVAAGSIEWQAPDGSVIPAISTTPIDAAQPDAFARLGISIGESFDASHGALMLFAHWPKNTCVWFDDLQRTMKYGNVLGRFATMHDVFQKASFSGRRERYSEDQYRSEFLAEAQLAEQPDPLSSVVEYWQNRQLLAQCGPLRFMAGAVMNSSERASEASLSDERVLGLAARNDRLVDGAESRRAGRGSATAPEAEDNTGEGSVSPNLREEIQSLYFDRSAELFKSLVNPDKKGTRSTLVVANPTSFARRVLCSVSAKFQGAQIEKPVYAADVGTQGGFLAVDVPPFGFAMVAGTVEKPAKRQSSPVIVDAYNLRNEYFDLEVDQQTGGIRSIHCYNRRGNLFSQMLGLRLPPGRRTTAGLDAAYSHPVVRSIQTSIDNAVVGEISVQGQLLVDNQPAADFAQRVRVVRGRRVIELDIDLVPLEPLTNDPWRHYACSRFAWPNESAELFRGMNETRCPIVEPRFEAPQWIEIVDGPNRVLVLTNGLPFHRRYDYRKLDCVLSVSGESRMHYRLGIGIDVPHATQAAVEFGSAALSWETGVEPRVPQSSAWLLRTNCRNVLITAVESMFVDQAGMGIRLRLKETEGRAGNGKIECARPITKARRVRLDGESKSELNIAEGAVDFGFAANEYLQIELLW